MNWLNLILMFKDVIDASLGTEKNTTIGTLQTHYSLV